jgi:hypothetical protein
MYFYLLLRGLLISVVIATPSTSIGARKMNEVTEKPNVLASEKIQ